MTTPLLAVVGPTASGKSALGIFIAEALGAEIVSVDSMLVYRTMDIGTAKPTREEQARVPHHLIDVAEPSEPFSVARFQHQAREAVRSIVESGSHPLLVGGSGLYFRAVVDDLVFPGTDPATRDELERQADLLGPAAMYERLAALDPAAAERIDPANVRRTIRALEVAAVTGRRFSSYADAWRHHPADRVRVVGIRVRPDVLRARIQGRVDAMIDAGWLHEVTRLVAEGFGDWLTASQAIGYAELARHLRGEMTLGDAVQGTVKRTTNLARRQMAWFRRDPRIRWFDVGTGGVIEVAEPILDHLRRVEVTV